MSILDRLRREVDGKDQATTCTHANRQDLRVMGAGGSAANRWRCRDCGFSPMGVAS